MKPVSALPANPALRAADEVDAAASMIERPGPHRPPEADRARTRADFDGPSGSFR